MFICPEQRTDLEECLSISSEIAIGNEGGDTSKLKLCYDKLDNFSRELAHKKRFNSHFLDFKRDIVEHTQKFKLAIIDLDKKQPWVRNDYATLWTALMKKTEDDEHFISLSLST